MRVLGSRCWQKKTKRRHSAGKTKTLDARFLEATWVGYSTRSNAHIVVVAGGGPAIRVRTLRPRPENERWNFEAVDAIKATPDAPNPCDAEQRDPRPERETRGMDFGARGGQDLPEQRTRPEPDVKRDFRITDRILEKYGTTGVCAGGEANIAGDGEARSHPGVQDED